jgi:hypothetical protein
MDDEYGDIPIYGPGPRCGTKLRPIQSSGCHNAWFHSPVSRSGRQLPDIGYAENLTQMGSQHDQPDPIQLAYRVGFHPFETNTILQVIR